MCKGGSNDTTTTTKTQIDPAVKAAYQALLARGQNVANTPLSQYGGSMVAGFTPQQTQAFGTIANSQGIAQPYINTAAQYAGQGAASVWPNVPQFGQDQVDKYMSPYTNDVINSTLGNINQQNAIQQSGMAGNAIQAGNAFGGDRAGVASAELARNQDLAKNQTIAQLYNQGYGQALGEFNTQQQTQIGAQQADAARASNAAYQFGGLGQEAQGSALTGASAQLQAGGLQQQLAQEQLNIPYEQFLQRQAYPFQTTNFLSGLTTGVGAGYGGSTSTTSPGPSTASQIAGLGLTGLGLAGSLFGLRSGGRIPQFGERFASGGAPGGVRGSVSEGYAQGYDAMPLGDLQRLAASAQPGSLQAHLLQQAMADKFQGQPGSGMPQPPQAPGGPAAPMFGAQPMAAGGTPSADFTGLPVPTSNDHKWTKAYQQFLANNDAAGYIAYLQGRGIPVPATVPPGTNPGTGNPGSTPSTTPGIPGFGGYVGSTPTINHPAPQPPYPGVSYTPAPGYPGIQIPQVNPATFQQPGQMPDYFNPLPQLGANGLPLLSPGPAASTPTTPTATPTTPTPSPVPSPIPAPVPAPGGAPAPGDGAGGQHHGNEGGGFGGNAAGAQQADRNGFGASVGGGNGGFGGQGATNSPSSSSTRSAGLNDFVEMPGWASGLLGAASTLAPFPYSLAPTLAQAGLRANQLYAGDQLRPGLSTPGNPVPEKSFWQDFGGVLGLNGYSDLTNPQITNAEQGVMGHPVTAGFGGDDQVLGENRFSPAMSYSMDKTPGIGPFGWFGGGEPALRYNNAVDIVDKMNTEAAMKEPGGIPTFGGGTTAAGTGFGGVVNPGISDASTTTGAAGVRGIGAGNLAPAGPSISMGNPVYSGNTKDGGVRTLVGYRQADGTIANPPSGGPMQSNGAFGNAAQSSLNSGRGATMSNPGGGTTALGSAGTGGLNNGFGGGGYADGGYIDPWDEIPMQADMDAEDLQRTIASDHEPLFGNAKMLYGVPGPAQDAPYMGQTIPRDFPMPGRKPPAPASHVIAGNAVGSGSFGSPKKIAGKSPANSRRIIAAPHKSESDILNEQSLADARARSAARTQVASYADGGDIDDPDYLPPGYRPFGYAADQGVEMRPRVMPIDMGVPFGGTAPPSPSGPLEQGDRIGPPTVASNVSEPARPMSRRPTASAAPPGSFGSPTPDVSTPPGPPGPDTGAGGASAMFGAPATGPASAPPAEGPPSTNGPPPTDEHGSFLSSPWAAIMAAGLGTLAGRSPHAAQNIGQGGLEGLRFAQQGQQLRNQERRLDRQEAYQQHRMEVEDKRLNQPHVSDAGDEVLLIHPDGTVIHTGIMNSSHQIAADREKWAEQHGGVMEDIAQQNANTAAAHLGIARANADSGHWQAVNYTDPDTGDTVVGRFNSRTGDLTGSDGKPVGGGARLVGKGTGPGPMTDQRVEIEAGRRADAARYANPAMTDAQYEATRLQWLERLKTAGHTPAAPAAAAPDATGAPAVGIVVPGDGGAKYRFKGGNPNDKANWEAVP